MRQNIFRLKTLLIFLLMFGILSKRSGSQVNIQEGHKTPEGEGGGSSAFFALRSCHQVLRADSGEFFSPDYLCSNPLLWCNWTIQVDPGKRVRLHLEDLAPDDACHFKQDQIHVDEPGGHKVLQKCWREAKHVSVSNTLTVVLLIGSQTTSPYRGLYGHYQAFGPPVVYNPHERARESWLEPAGTELAHDQMDFTEYASVMEGEPREAVFLERATMPPSPANYDLMDDYYGHTSTMATELPWEAPEEDTAPRIEEDGGQVGENHLPDSDSHSDESHFTATPATPVSTRGTSHSETDATQTFSGRPGQDTSPLPSSDWLDPEPQPKPSPRTPTAIRRNVDAQTGDPITFAAPKGNSAAQRPTEAKTQTGDNELIEASEQRSPASDEPELTEAEEAHPHPIMVEPLSNHRERIYTRNHSEASHFPGDHLLEVTVEVEFPEVPDKSWDNTVRSLLLSVKALIYQHLDVLHTPKVMTSKRIKRLSAGVLYILWLQIGQAPGGSHVQEEDVHATLQDLISTAISLREKNRTAVVVSVSTADVNECGTQLMLCDINAECMNKFGSYLCRCRPGFQDKSQVGSGGTVCVDVKATGYSSGSSAETKGVYVLFFVLSSLILMLLAAAGVLYHRRHHRAFPVRCHGSSSSICPPDTNNNINQSSYYGSADSDLPHPPLPVRRPRDGWAPPKDGGPTMDLPLLCFTPLLQEGGKM